MNKKEYLTPIIEVITIKSNEIIVTSDMSNPEEELPKFTPGTEDM